MKKTYIIPEVVTVLIGTEQLIAESMERGSNTITDQSQILVKGQGNSQSYDVWDDDWSK